MTGAKAGSGDQPKGVPPTECNLAGVVHTAVLMDTLVRIEIPYETPERCADVVERAFCWFREVEAICSRFDEQSELMSLTRHPGVPCSVSPLLFEVIRFALGVAEATGGAFDPTVGAMLEQRGFNRNYRTGAVLRTPLSAKWAVSYRDVIVDAATHSVTLRQPLILDLGAVAKGFAIDLAARELAPLVSYAIDAGGDLFLAGTNVERRPWRVGIRHPRDPGALLTTIQVTNQAVCTSGDYLRTVAEGHHIINPSTGRAVDSVCSATVVAPTAMAADALGTAAFVLGMVEGVRFLEEAGVEGLLVSPNLKRRATSGFRRYEQ